MTDKTTTTTDEDRDGDDTIDYDCHNGNNLNDKININDILGDRNLNGNDNTNNTRYQSDDDNERDIILRPLPLADPAQKIHDYDNNLLDSSFIKSNYRNNLNDNDDDVNYSKLLRNLSINNPFYQFHKKSVSLNELPRTSSSFLQLDRKYKYRSMFSIKLLNGNEIVPELFKDKLLENRRDSLRKNTILTKENLAKDFTDNSNINLDSYYDNTVITNPFSIFHESKDELVRVMIVSPRTKRKPANKVAKKLPHSSVSASEARHYLYGVPVTRFDRQDYNLSTSCEVKTTEKKKFLKQLSLKKLNTTKSMFAVTVNNTQPHIKRLKISYPNSSHSLSSKINTNPNKYFEKIQMKTRLGLQKLREKCKNFAHNSTDDNFNKHSKDESFRYVKHPQHYNSSEKDKQVLYKSYKSEIDLTKNLHYLDAYLEQSYDAKKQSQSVGRAAGKRYHHHQHRTTSSSVSSSDYASVFSGTSPVDHLDLRYEHPKISENFLDNTTQQLIIDIDDVNGEGDDVDIDEFELKWQMQQHYLNHHQKLTKNDMKYESYLDHYNKSLHKSDTSNVSTSPLYFVNEHATMSSTSALSSSSTSTHRNINMKSAAVTTEEKGCTTSIISQPLIPPITRSRNHENDFVLDVMNEEQNTKDCVVVVDGVDRMYHRRQIENLRKYYQNTSTSLSTSSSSTSSSSAVAQKYQNYHHRRPPTLSTSYNHRRSDSSSHTTSSSNILPIEYDSLDRENVHNNLIKLKPTYQQQFGRVAANATFNYQQQAQHHRNHNSAHYKALNYSSKAKQDHFVLEYEC